MYAILKSVEHVLRGTYQGRTNILGTTYTAHLDVADANARCIPMDCRLQNALHSPINQYHSHSDHDLQG